MVSTSNIHCRQPSFICNIYSLNKPATVRRKTQNCPHAVMQRFWISNKNAVNCRATSGINFRLATTNVATTWPFRPMDAKSVNSFFRLAYSILIFCWFIKKNFLRPISVSQHVAPPYSRRTCRTKNVRPYSSTRFPMESFCNVSTDFILPPSTTWIGVAMIVFSLLHRPTALVWLVCLFKVYAFLSFAINMVQQSPMTSLPIRHTVALHVCSK